MEEKLFLSGNVKKSAIFLILFFVLLPLRAQQSLRFQLWAHLEPLPSSGEPAVSAENPYEPAVQNLKKLAPFILEGMIYGWNFSYTPSDSLRGVTEFFEFKPVQTLEKNDARLVFDNFFREESRLYCWVTYTLSDGQERLVKSWQSVMYPKIQGSGSSSLFDGTDSIPQAYSGAIQNAVRSYAQSLIKNKPKEITGTVILDGMPRLRVVAGRYIADLTLYLSVKEIIPYSVF